MTKQSYALLAVTLLGGLSGWFIAAPTYAALTTPQAVGGLMAILASTLTAAFGVKVSK